MATNDVQYITDTDGQQVGVIVPIDLWRQIASERVAVRAGKATSLDGRPAASDSRVSDMTLEEAGIEICGETGLPVFRVAPDSPKITTEFVKQLDSAW